MRAGPAHPRTHPPTHSPQVHVQLIRAHDHTHVAERAHTWLAPHHIHTTFTPHAIGPFTGSHHNTESKIFTGPHYTPHTTRSCMCSMQRAYAETARAPATALEGSWAHMPATECEPRRHVFTANACRESGAQRGAEQTL